MKRYVFVWILFLAVTLETRAQKERIQTLIDSLTSVVRISPEDTKQCDRYCSLSNLYRQIDSKQSLKWAQKAINLSEKLRFANGLKCGYNNEGITHYSLGEYHRAIQSFESYKEVCARNNDSTNLAWGYNNIGNVYIDLARYDSTILYYDSAYRVRLLQKDSNALAQSLTNYGYIYKELGNYTYSLVNLYQAIRVLEPLKNETALSYAYDFIGSVYALRKQHKYAINYYLKALALYEKLHNRSGKAIALHTLGTSYIGLNQKVLGKQYLQQAYSIYLDMKDMRQLALISSTLGNIHLSEKKTDSAAYFARQSINYHKRNNDKRLLASAYLTLAKALFEQHQQSTAIQQARYALDMSTQTGERNTRKEALLMLGKMCAEAGLSAEAYAYREQHDLLKDSILNETTEKTIAELETKYETAKKDSEIAHQAAEIKNKEAQLSIVILIGCTLALILVFYYNRYRLKQKIELEQERVEQQIIRNKAIIEAEEKERIRIARELHDGIGQQLSATKMNLSAFEPVISDEQKDRYHQILELVDDAVKEVRTISHNMMPNALLRSGLSSAVREFVQKISGTNSLKVDLQIVGLNNRLDSNIETVLYRVIQECVSNIIKHADASHITIQLIKHDVHLNLVIEDNGKGFDTRNIENGGGIGLKNIISRVDYLNGSVEFDSMPGKGTTVVIDIPLISDNQVA